MNKKKQSDSTERCNHQPTRLSRPSAPSKGETDTRNKPNINEWAEADRPREKLCANGAAALTNAEILAILIGSGSPEETAVSLMQRILIDCRNSLDELGKKDLNELCRYKGIGMAKAVSLLAACELGRRRAAELPLAKTRIQSSNDIFQYFGPQLQDLPHEEGHVLLLNNRLHIIGSRLIGRGGITGTTVDIRLVLREALLARATSIALCHNHPSGNLQPSRDDDRLTQSLKQAAETMQIRLIDHVIIGGNQFYSYADEGRI